MEVHFREFDPFNLWIWLELETVPSPLEQQYLEEVFNSWFYLGKLGSFNAENLQVSDQGIEISYMEYDNTIAEQVLMAPMHNMSDFQYSGVWGRCWLDLGTSDLFALDVLINALRQLSQEYVPIQRLIIGGQNEDWPVDSTHHSMFVEN
jgi:hypothetical protein